MLDEELIPVNEVPSYLPKRRGKSVHIATIYRWIKRGAHGRKLEICVSFRERLKITRKIHRCLSIASSWQGQLTHERLGGW